jgi:hypothetical protein
MEKQQEYEFIRTWVWWGLFPKGQSGLMTVLSLEMLYFFNKAEVMGSLLMALKRVAVAVNCTLIFGI